MITHSQACRAQWHEPAIEMPWWDAAWHYTCDETCVNEMGHTEAVHHDWKEENPVHPLTPTRRTP